MRISDWSSDVCSSDLVTADGLWPALDRPDMIDALSRLIAPFDRVIIACRFDHRSAWATFLKGHDVGGEILLDRDLLHGAVAIGQYDSRDTIILSRGPLNLMNRIQKRPLALVVAYLALAQPGRTWCRERECQYR